MVENVKRHAKFSKEYLLLIVDESALKVFSSSCKFFELFEADLYHVEKLEVKRKRFPHLDAIYFISPERASVNRLIEDFKKEDVPYGGVHLCFLSQIADELIVEIAKSKNLAPRVLSFNEINLDFYLFNDHVFTLKKQNILAMFKMDVRNQVVQKHLDETARRLFTVCAVFQEFPYVAFQGNSEFAKELAEKVH